MNKFKIGDKVRLNMKYINSHYEIDSTFREDMQKFKNDIFTIINIESNFIWDHIEVDHEIINSWGIEAMEIKLYKPYKRVIKGILK